MAEPEEIIRASEVGQYAFCARAWWLGRILGYRSANLEAMARGTSSHLLHGRVVERYHLLRRVAASLILLAVIALAAWVLFGLGG